MGLTNDGKATLEDEEIVNLYHIWSEETWCAGFIDLNPDILEDFMNWLSSRKTGYGEREEFKDYEIDLIRQFRARLDAAHPTW